MAKTSAERQAAYRARRLGHDSGERRINTWVSTAAYRKLEELAIRYGVTRRAVIELLLSHEDGTLKELAAKVSGAESGVAKVARVAVLRRNPSKEAAVDAKPAPLVAGRLRRNKGSENAVKQVVEQPVQVEQPKRPPAHDGQYGFEF